jgi:acyl-CoA dehydrogenase
MDFAYSPRVLEMREQLWDFMNTHVIPAEKRYFAEFSAATVPHHISSVMEDLKSEARSRGLWNLFLPDKRFGAGLTNLEYAPLAEITGHSLIAAEAINCSAPDTGNMEVLARFGTPEQQETWLKPLLAGEIRSCVAITEPGVASSDPTNLSCRIEQDGDEFVITGRKWWTSGAAHPLARVSLLMGLSDPDADRQRRHSFVLVPMDAHGFGVVRQLEVFGYDDPGGHCEVTFDEVRVPATHLIGERGAAFAIAQARLGPGRIHHCMRVIGTAERALALMCERARTRTAFGKLLAEQGVVQQAIARSRVELEQVRLLCHKAAWLMDTQGAKASRTEIAAIKVAAPQVACDIVDRAIQVHGGAGMSNDLPLARMYAWTRALRILDGPDEVHLQTIARQELRRT